MLKELEKEAKKKGLKIKDLSDGHFQILNGPLLVNYYPFSKNRTAHVKGTKKGIEQVSIKKAVELAFEVPKREGKVKRKSSYKKAKLRLLKKNPFCHWCKEPLTKENATVEHIIPLVRGGLDNRNNMKLACLKCNNERGSGMPEIENLQESR